MSFHKKFVRVESLAIQRAFELAKEVGCADLYLAKSVLTAEKGDAIATAYSGQPLFDRGGQVVKIRRLEPEEMSLRGEIEAFAFPDDSQGDWNGGPVLENSEAFLERQYHLAFNGPKNHEEMLWVGLVFIMKTRESDWALKSEVVTKASQPGVFFPTTGTVISREFAVPA